MKKPKITKAYLASLDAKSEQLWQEFKNARKVSDRLYRQYQKASDAWLSAKLEQLEAKERK